MTGFSEQFLLSDAERETLQSVARRCWNLFGLRGTQGLSSRQGIVPLASTQDIGGPLARTANHHRGKESVAVNLKTDEGLDRVIEWVRRDVGRVFVQTFDVALAAWSGARPGLCIHEETCGTALAMETIEAAYDATAKKPG